MIASSTSRGEKFLYCWIFSKALSIIITKNCQLWLICEKIEYHPKYTLHPEHQIYFNIKQTIISEILPLLAWIVFWIGSLHCGYFFNFWCVHKVTEGSEDNLTLGKLNVAEKTLQNWLFGKFVEKSQKFKLMEL